MSSIGVNIPEPPVMDLRDLPPPQPMACILEATTRLQPGEKLIAYLRHEPQPLYPRLAERGLRAESEEREAGLVAVTIYRPAPEKLPPTT